MCNPLSSGYLLCDGRTRRITQYSAKGGMDPDGEQKGGTTWSCQILCGEFGFGHLAALTVHRTVIHYRSAVRFAHYLRVMRAPIQLRPKIDRVARTYIPQGLATGKATNESQKHRNKFGRFLVAFPSDKPVLTLAVVCLRLL